MCLFEMTSRMTILPGGHFYMKLITETYNITMGLWRKFDPCMTRVPASCGRQGNFYDQAGGSMTDIGTDWLISRHMV